jgi:hypothetical protein
VIVIFRACASMLFSTSSAIAFSGLLCDRAMILMAFQSSPIRSLPFASAALAMSQSDSVLGSNYTRRWYREIAIPVQPNSVHHDQSFFQKVDPRFLGISCADHTVPYGTVLSRDAFPGTSCQATIGVVPTGRAGRHFATASS